EQDRAEHRPLRLEALRRHLAGELDLGGHSGSRDARASYSAATETVREAVTSPCRRTGTLYSPSALIGSSSCTRRFSTGTWFRSRNSTTSCAETEPYSRPSSDARAVTVSVSASIRAAVAFAISSARSSSFARCRLRCSRFFT